MTLADLHRWVKELRPGARIVRADSPQPGLLRIAVDGIGQADRASLASELQERMPAYIGLDVVPPPRRPHESTGCRCQGCEEYDRS
jgi:hypothetical protein